MKDERFPVYLSLVTMLFFLACTFTMYKRISSNFDIVKKVNEASIVFMLDGSPTVSINNQNVLSGQNNVIGQAEANISVSHTGIIDNYKFEFRLHNYNSYEKSLLVDGINNHEYTIEIYKQDKLLLKELEIPSFDSGSDTILVTDTLTNSSDMIKYKLIFRFYNVPGAENNMIGKSFNNYLYIQKL